MVPLSGVGQGMGCDAVFGKEAKKGEVVTDENRIEGEERNSNPCAGEVVRRKEWAVTRYRRPRGGPPRSRLGGRPPRSPSRRCPPPPPPPPLRRIGMNSRGG